MTLTCDHCGELYDGGDRPAQRRRYGDNGAGKEMFSCWPCFSNAIDRTPVGSNPFLRQYLGLPPGASDEAVRDAIKASRLKAMRREVRPA